MSRLTPKELADDFRVWYSGGQKGLETVMNTGGTTAQVKSACDRWYRQGFARFNELCKRIEELEDE